jgi:hypothetical protein
MNPLVEGTLLRVTAAIGSFSASLLSIYLGYRLFIMAARGRFLLGPKVASGEISYPSILPGVLLAVLGLALAAWTAGRLLPKAGARPRR